MLAQDVSGVRTLHRRDSGCQLTLVGVPLAFGLLHLLLFAFQPRSPANLYYGLLALSIAVVLLPAVSLATLLTLSLTTRPVTALYLTGQLAMYTLGLRFLYAAFQKRPPWVWWLLLGASAPGLGVMLVCLALGVPIHQPGSPAILGASAVILGLLL